MNSAVWERFCSLRGPVLTLPQRGRQPELSGWVGGWMGGDQKGPSIWLKIEYNNKQGALIPNMALKVVYGY